MSVVAAAAIGPPAGSVRCGGPPVHARALLHLARGGRVLLGGGFAPVGGREAVGARADLSGVEWRLGGGGRADVEGGVRIPGALGEGAEGEERKEGEGEEVSLGWHFGGLDSWVRAGGA